MSSYKERLNDTYKEVYDYYSKNGYTDLRQLFEQIDYADEDYSTGMLDWLADNKPEIYNKYMDIVKKQNVDFLV